jgi:ketol-acid reductoisomerase
VVGLGGEGGFWGGRCSISDTAQWGDYVAGDRIIDAGTKDRMRELLSEIQSGEFAKGWIEENETGRPNFNAITEREEQHSIEAVGQKLREMMPFVNAGKKEKEVVTSAKD